MTRNHPLARSLLRILPLLALIAIALPACGGDDKAGGGGGLPGAGGGVEGTWVMDTAQFASDFEKAMREQAASADSEVPAEMLDAMIQGQVERMRSARMTLTIASGGTWSGEFSGMDREEPGSASGTWTQEGDTLTIVTTHEDGEPKDEPETMTGTFAGNQIRVNLPDADMAIQMVFNRE